MAKSNAIVKAREIAHSLDEDRARHFSALGEVRGKVLHSQVMCIGYVPRAVTAGGIHLPDRTLEEERFQGKIFLVVATGPGAFKDDKIAEFHGETIEVGDWVLARTSDGLEMFCNGNSVRLFEDVDIRIKVENPEDWY